MTWVLKPGAPMDTKKARRLLWQARLLPWLAGVVPLLGMVRAAAHHATAAVGGFAVQMIIYPVAIGFTARSNIAKLKRMIEEDDEPGKE